MANYTINFVAKPSTTLNGELSIPGDKSISHRSIMFGSIAKGRTTVTGFLEGADALATLNAFRALGVTITGPHDGRVEITGVGLHGLQPSTKPLDMGNSGTSMRLLSGLLSGQGFNSELVGDASLSKRPMRRVTDPLTQMGAKIESTDAGTAPLRIYGTNSLQGIKYAMPMASAQVKSCLLLAGMYGRGITRVTEPAPTRDHTERMLTAFGYEVEKDANHTWLEGGGSLTACDIEVPADISSAAFFLVAGAIAEEGELTLRAVGMNPTRTGVLEILWLMGADIDVVHERMVGGEPVADLIVKASALKGIEIPEALVPLAIDEFPALFIAACAAKGKTILTGAKELRVKESDRIQVMADGINALGGTAEATPDGMVINGGRLKGGRVNSHHDHRIAMSFSVASLISDGDILVEDCATVGTSFPNFSDLATSAGLNLEVQQA